MITLKLLGQKNESIAFLEMSCYNFTVYKDIILHCFVLLKLFMMTSSLK